MTVTHPKGFRASGVAAGWYLMLRPPAPGAHVVRMTVEASDGRVFLKTYRLAIGR